MADDGVRTMGSGLANCISADADCAVKNTGSDPVKKIQTLRDLMAPPGNRLEALKGDRKGQHSIRINDQWRMCFRWSDGHAYDVEIVDYHS